MVSSQFIKAIGAILFLQLIGLLYGYGCKDGWFGDKCQYKCHCDSNSTCLKTGQCDKRCQVGFFGPACQYVDHAKTAHSTPGTGWINDGNDDTCGSHKNTKYELTLKFRVPVLISWLRLVGNVPYKVLEKSINITFNDGSDMRGLQTASPIGKTGLDVVYSSHFTASQLELRGFTLKHLCSLYVSGGRNVALRQATYQSSTLDAQTTSSDRAVDGHTGYGSGYICCNCSRASVGDLSPWWTVMFTIPVTVYSITIYGYDPLVSCPRWWLFDPEHNMCYNEFRDRAEWEVARNRCVEIGATLAVVKSFTAIDYNKYFIRVGEKYWIGMTDEDDEGEWRWVDGTLVDENNTFWASGEPDNIQGDENCGVLYRSGNWGDEPCTSSLPYICQKARLNMNGFSLTGYIDNETAVFDYMDIKADYSAIHYLTFTGLSPTVMFLNLTADDLGICEFEVYGDTWCEENRWGFKCEDACNCLYPPCSSSTGGCANGCPLDYYGDQCTEFREPPILFFDQSYWAALMVPTLMALFMVSSHILKVFHSEEAATQIPPKSSEEKSTGATTSTELSTHVSRYTEFVPLSTVSSGETSVD